MAHDEFDPEAFKLIRLLGETLGPSKIRVGIWQYKDNAPKVRVYRTGKRKDGTEYMRPEASFTAEEAIAIAPLLASALD